MPYVHATALRKRNRIWGGWLAVVLSVSWWIVSVGGIIYVIKMTS